VAESNVHVTLKFLGQVDEPRLPAVIDALGVVARSRGFDVDVRGLGAFPSAARARVVWAGLDAARPLAALAAAIDGALAELGFPRESRPFAAHVTLGRVREPRRQPALGDALTRGGDFGRLPVTAVSLMRSELHPRGARYTELARIALAEAASPVE
jgi:2'-5' RNA ligase